MGAGTTCERGELEKNIKTRCNKLYTATGDRVGQQLFGTN
jgi:hypothetical protein